MKRWTQRAINLRERFSKKTIITSLIIFAVSIIIYNATNNEMWDALSGFAMIISGAIFVLFLISLFILWTLERMTKNKESQIVKKAPAKKIVKKKVTKKKVTTKKKTTSKKRK